MCLMVFTPSATLPRSSPYCVLTTVFIGIPPSKRVAGRSATSEDMVCVWGGMGRTKKALSFCPRCRALRSGLLRLDRGVAQTIAAFDQFFQPLGETCCRSPVDRLVIKADRQTQIVPDGDVPVHDPRLLTNAAHRHPEGMGRERNSPSSPFPKHPHCCDAHRPPVLLPHLGRPFPHPHHHPKDWEQQQPGPMDGFEPLPGFCHVLHLGCPDLVMNLTKGLAIGCSDDVGQSLFLASHVTLNRGIYVHLIKQDEALAAFAIGLHGFVLIDGLCQAGDEERRERQGLSSDRFVLS